MQASSSNPNSLIDMSKIESLALSENARASLSLDKAVEYEQNYGNGFDPTMDLKKIRRIMSNRLSAQRARLRKSKYVTDMENMVKHLEDMISDLTSQMKDCKKKMDLLMIQNQSLQTLLELRLNEARFSEVEVEKNKMEVNRLRELQVALCLNKHLIHNNVNHGSYKNGLHKFEANQLKPLFAPSLILRKNPPGEGEGEAEADQYLNLED